ncbi:MAG: hypothetical protein V4538_17170 [Bacteroidota bacterium]
MKKNLIVTCLIIFNALHVTSQNLLNSKKIINEKMKNEMNLSENDTNLIDNFQSNASFISLFQGNNNVNFIPNFDILLTNKFQKDSATYSIKIFTGNAGIDTSLENNALRLLLVETSKIGFKFNCIQPIKFKGSMNQSINFDLNILYKDFPLRKDTQIIGNTNSLIFHGKIGFEKLIAKDLFSIYYNLNYIYFLTGVGEVKSLFNKSNSYYLFHDFGCRMQFSLGENNMINVDLGAIPVNGDIFKLYNSTNDNIIPTIRVGYTKYINN